MQYLIVDVETYSEADIRSVGAYRYISDPSFELLMTGYALDDADPVCEEGTPSEDFCEMLYDPNVIKVAHNAPFEREVFHRVFGRVCPPEQWLDTMALAAYCGLPLSLAAVCRALGFAEDKQKDTRGKRLIQYFSKPCKPTKKNGGRTRNLPEHDPNLWQEYKEYNIQDVVSEREVLRTLIRYAPPEDEQKMWCLDQRINDRGVRIDRAFAVAASEMGEDYKTEKLEEARLLTGIDNPSSVAQVKAYIEDTEGIEVESLNKKAIPDVMAQLDTEETQELMHLREEFSKSANKKYDAMLRSLCPDDHVRGCFQYGGTHTLRWAGRLVQMQNMKQNHLPDLDAARTLVRTGDTEAVELLYGSVSDVLGQLTRTALIPEDGCRFVVSDFSAIEARVVSWMAGETWVTEAFRQGKDIYCEVASQMFGVPVAKHGPNAELRQKGKIALLACGYGGGVNALKAFGADKMGMSEELQQEIVDKWRASNPHIVSYWKRVERAAISAVVGHSTTTLGDLAFKYERGTLWVHLPSGRAMAYHGAQYAESSRRQGKTLSYMGVDQQTRRWVRVETFGGRLVENLVQAVARDILRDKMLALDAAGFDIRGHVHDEVILSVPREITDAKEQVSRIMGEELRWTAGLPLNAESYECDYYQKD